jgi:hypothetical protein
MVVEVLVHLPQVLMLCLHDGLTNTEVRSTGRELAVLTSELADDLFMLLMQLTLSLH